MNCLMIAPSPEQFPMRKENSTHAYRLREHVRTALLEIYYNGFDLFTCPLRRGYEIFMGEMLADMRPAYGHMRVAHVFPYKKYHNCKKAEEYYYLLSVSDICDYHFNLHAEPDTDVLESLTAYCRDKVDLLFSILVPNRPDIESETLIDAALKADKPTIRIIPSSLEIVASNMPRNWLTYNEWREIYHYRKEHPPTLYM